MAKRITMFLICIAAVLILALIWGACSMLSAPAAKSNRIKNGSVLVAINNISENSFFKEKDYTAVHVDLSEPNALTPEILESYEGKYLSKINIVKGTQITKDYFEKAPYDRLSAAIFPGERLYKLAAMLDGEFGEGESVSVVSGEKKYTVRFISALEGGAFIAARPEDVQEIFLLEYTHKLISVVKYEEEFDRI